MLTQFGRIIFGTALLVAFASPSRAQNVGAGLSFMGRSGTGLTVDYELAQKALSNGRSLGSVIDASFHHEGFDDGSANNTLTAQGGVRANRPNGGNLTWHLQALLGLVRVSLSNSDEFQQVCDSSGLDCGLSRYALLITPGVGMDYAIGSRMAVRVHLDVPVANLTSPVTRVWFGFAVKVKE